jgi:spore germination cell wall hydrolase CwlJ-like protein
MSKKLHRASAIAVAAMIGTIIFSANGSGASAQNVAADTVAQAVDQTLSQPVPVLAPVLLPAPVAPAASETSAPELDALPPIHAGSLAALVAAQPQPGELSRELHCLAGAIYFEAKSESLTGQLAVGRVIVARSKSGRFPNSYCGVVFQPSQFSFVRGSSMPGIARASHQWKNAVAIAQIAHTGTWRSPVEGALYFHAAYVSPGWHLKRVGRIENHVFYR